MQPDIDALLLGLRDRSSKKRRAAAKRLRKLGDMRACSQLLDALRIELEDERTWETQYQLIMALGESGCTIALPLVLELAERKFWATMRLVAIGDAMVRLGRVCELDSKPVFAALSLARSNDPLLAEGAMRAVAMLRLKYDEDIASKLIDNVLELDAKGTIFWTAAACAGWSGPVVHNFLELCMLKKGREVAKAATLSLAGKYQKYHPA